MKKQNIRGLYIIPFLMCLVLVWLKFDLFHAIVFYVTLFSTMAIYWDDLWKFKNKRRKK